MSIVIVKELSDENDLERFLSSLWSNWHNQNNFEIVLIANDDNFYNELLKVVKLAGYLEEMHLFTMEQANEFLSSNELLKKNYSLLIIPENISLLRFQPEIVQEESTSDYISFYFVLGEPRGERNAISSLSPFFKYTIQNKTNFVKLLDLNSNSIDHEGEHYYKIKGPLDSPSLVPHSFLRHFFINKRLRFSERVKIVCQSQLSSNLMRVSSKLNFLKNKAD